MTVDHADVQPELDVRVSFTVHERMTILRLSGSMTGAAIATPTLATPDWLTGTVVVDLADVLECDTAGILLLERTQHVIALGGSQLILINVSSAIRQRLADHDATHLLGGTVTFAEQA